MFRRYGRLKDESLFEDLWSVDCRFSWDCSLFCFFQIVVLLFFCLVALHCMANIRQTCHISNTH